VRSSGDSGSWPEIRAAGVEARRDAAEDGLAVDLEALSQRRSERLEQKDGELLAVDRRTPEGERLRQARRRVGLQAAPSGRFRLGARVVAEALPDVGDDGEIECHFLFLPRNGGRSFA
jgi:hypothetical protein